MGTSRAREGAQRPRSAGPWPEVGWGAQHIHTVAEWPQRQDPQLTPKAAGTRRFVAN